VIVSQAEADRDRGAKTADPDPEPWPETEQTHGLRARIGKNRPPPLIEETVRGIYAIPPDTESLRLVFDHTGRLVHYMELPPEIVIGAVAGTNHYMAFPHFVKTQGATGSHVALCLLLQLLKRKYMPKLVVRDDTGFYKSGNLADLEQSHAELSAILGVLKRSKDLGGLLRWLGMEVADGKVRLLEPDIPKPAPAGKAAKPVVN
jgi:hypothetical protein